MNPWLTHTSPSLTHPWFGLKTGSCSWCPLFWEHLKYSHDNWGTYQRLAVTHIHTTDWSLQLIMRSLSCYCSPLHVQLWSQYIPCNIPWLTVHYHIMTKAVISLLQVAKKCAQMQYIQTFLEICVAVTQRYQSGQKYKVQKLFILKK